MLPVHAGDCEFQALSFAQHLPLLDGVLLSAVVFNDIFCSLLRRMFSAEGATVRVLTFLWRLWHCIWKRMVILQGLHGAKSNKLLHFFWRVWIEAGHDATVTHFLWSLTLVFQLLQQCLCPKNTLQTNGSHPRHKLQCIH
eukprot:Skav212603  [mRNA]  locus=scaffold2176:96661:99004:+ [translate_table: standard]